MWYVFPNQTLKTDGSVPMSQSSKIVDMSPSQVRELLASDEIVLIDVREPFEHAEARIEGAALHTLSTFDPEAIRREHPEKRVVFHCKAGGRSAKAAEQFRLPDAPAYHLAGGIDAWIQSGFPVVRSERRPPIPIMRQVQITAGAFVAAGTALGAFVSPWFLILPAFVGCGLVFAGASGYCGMATLLARMPWNSVAWER